MSNRFLLFLFLLSGNYFIQAQEIFQATLSDAVSTNNLEQQFRSYQLMEVDIDAIQSYLQQEEKNIEVPLSLKLPSGTHWDMVLTENGLLSQDYKLYVGGGDEVNLQSEKRTIGTYSGHLSNGSGQVAVTVNQNFFYAYIRLSNESYFIEPLRGFDKTASAQDLIMYRASDVIADHEHICASDKLADRKTELNPTVAEKSADQCYILQIAIASDYAMYTKYNNSTTDVENHNIGVMNNVQLDYRSEFADNLEYVITGQFVETTNSNTFSTTTDAEDLLNDFADWATSGTRNGFNMMNIPHNRGQLWITRDIVFNGNASTIGLASTPGTYHILEDYSASASDLRGLTSHELGHNYSLTHDGGSGFIMSPSNSGSDIWSNQSVNQFNSYLSSIASGLSNCSTMGAPIAGFVVDKKITCVNSPVTYKDNSRYGATRSWSNTGGTPSSGTTPKLSVNYTSVGNYGPTLQSTNASGSNTVNNGSLLKVVNAVNAPCAATGNGTGGGITIVQLNTISNNTNNSSAGKFEDFYCEQITELEPNTTYNLLVNFISTSGNHRIAFWIDYNGNNDLSDPGERQFYSTPASPGFYGLPFTTPANPTVLDQLLRFRVIVDPNQDGNPCTAPTDGQVEDYAVFFASTPSLPIELVQFKGVQQQENVALNWKTATEKDNNYFQLEHSFDGRNFTKITQIKGKGDANNEQTYRHIHTTPNNGINYYKLYQVDFSGKKTWLKTIAVDVQLTQMASIFPNPVSGNQLNLRLNTVSAKPLQIQIINIQGQTVLSHQLKVDNGQMNYNIPLDANLAAGVYHLRIMDKDNQQQQTLRLVKR